MTPEQLLKPRWMVIADYPHSPFIVDDILTADDKGELMGNELGYVGTKVRIMQSDVDKWPHIFKPLQWHEQRKMADMPDYMKNTSGEVYKVNKTECIPTHFKVAGGGLLLWWPRQPATEAEYLAYKNTLK